MQGCRPRGLAPPDFSRSVNPTSTLGADYAQGNALARVHKPVDLWTSPFAPADF